jgi:hypothetical protein
VESHVLWPKDYRARLGEVRVILTRLCWENIFIVEKVLNPCHDIVNVRGRGKMDTLAILINPRVVETAGR